MMKQYVLVVRILLLASLPLIINACADDSIAKNDDDSGVVVLPTEPVDEKGEHLADSLFGTTWDYLSGDLKYFYLGDETGNIFNHEISFLANGNIKSIFTISQGQKGADDIVYYNTMDFGNTHDSICIWTFEGDKNIECKLAFTDLAQKNKLILKVMNKDIVYRKREANVVIDENMIIGNWEYITSNSDSGKKEFRFDRGGTGYERSMYINGKWFGGSTIKWSMESERVMTYCPDYIVESVGTEHWYIQFCNQEYMKLGDMYLKRIKK